MFCEKCGNKIEEGLKFCSNCGAAVQAEETAPQPVAEAAPIVAEEKTAKKGGKKWLAVGGIAVAAIFGAFLILLAAIVIVVVMILNSKGYEKEVKNYLNYYAEQEDKAETFIDEGYFAGEFGTFLTGKEATEINKILLEAMLEEEVFSDSYYGETSYDTWEELIEDMVLERNYDMMERRFGDDWKLTYEIEESEKLSKSDIEDLEEVLEECVEYYEDMVDELDLSSKDEKKVEKFINKYSNMKIKQAYEVKVKIEIDGDDYSLEEDYEFEVAKLGRDWVILTGPSLYDFVNDAED